MNLLDNTPNQSPKFGTKNWLQVNDDTRGRYNTNSQSSSKITMLKSSNYSDAYLLIKGT